MANSDFRLITNNSDKQIEDVIDARKKTGQYNIDRHPTVPIMSQNSLCRKAYSTPVTGINEEGRQIFADNTALWIKEGDLCNYPGEPGIFNVGPTDSEITVIRVKQEGLRYKSDENKWNLHDEAVPGDGTHLGESPSLVNLVTLVERSNKAYEYNEYLVPLSSWDPCDNPYQLPRVLSNNSGRPQTSNKPELHVIKPPNIPERHPSLAGRITNFLRKRYTKMSKSSITPENEVEVVMKGESGNS